MSPVLTLEAAASSKSSLNFYESKRRHIPTANFLYDQHDGDLETRPVVILSLAQLV